MRVLIPILAFFLPSVCFAEPVCKVHDGDTFRTCSGTSVRMNGIDAPELKQPYGYVARDALRRMILYKDVQLTCKGKSFKRRVCTATLTGHDIGEAMVQQGYAFDATQFSKGRYKTNERSAQARRVGLWVQPDGGIRPWDWRRAQRQRYADRRASKAIAGD